MRLWPLPLAALAALWTSLALLPLPISAAAPPLNCPDAQTLCLQADRTGGIDLKNGTAFMEGNVVGFLRQDKISFSSETLKAFRNAAGEWVKLVLDRTVHVEQTTRSADAEHAVVETKTVVLFGNVRLSEEDKMVATADEARFDRETENGTLTGNDADPVHIRFNAQTDTEGATGREFEAPPAPEPPDTFVITAKRADMDKTRRDVRLLGDVTVNRVEKHWVLTAQDVHLVFTAEHKLDYFRAEGAVVLKQPGRTAKADTAISRNNNDTILLLGNARVVQEGQFDLSSDRIEMYTSVDKGLVQSDQQQKPLTLNLNLSGKETYRLTSGGLDSLTTQGMPDATRAKLRPLVGQTFATLQVFRQRVRERLSTEEANAYLQSIVSIAKQP